MNLPRNSSHPHHRAGMLILECVVYLSVFALLLGIATTAFFFCWDHSKALIYTTDDIASALRVGERWRADVRGATGKIIVETTAVGEVVQIPEGRKKVLYRFDSGEVRRQLASTGFSELLLPKVKTSEMKLDARGNVIAWRWELELTQRRREAHQPLVFTFEAAQVKP